MNRSKSKYFDTAVRMDEAFIELLEKKDFAYITVKEICEKPALTALHFTCIMKRLTTFWRKARNI